MARVVHYEVFRRRGSKGSWSLIEIRQEREDAIAFAQQLMSGDATGVKVVKETYCEETGDYLSLKIFEDGHNKMKVAPAQEDVPTSPCFKPDDLYSYHARKTISTLIPDFLAHHRVTVTEFGHRADLLEKFEAAGTMMQHAIQRVAVAQAASGEEQLPKIIKHLNELVTKCIHRVYRDSKKGHFAAAKPGKYGALAAKLAANSDGRYLLNGSITTLLKDAKGWDEKVLRLMELMYEAQGDSPGAQLLLSCIDSLISEILTGPASLHELIGKKEHHGAAVMSLVKLFLGREPDEPAGRDGLISLTKRFASDELPDSRGAVASRIISEFRGFKRLCPDSLEEELKTLRQIANLVVMGIGKYMSHEDLVAAFTLRSSRLITNEVLGSYLSGVPYDVKLERLLLVEENIIGSQNKRQLGSFFLPVVTAAGFEEIFQNTQVPLVARLQRLEALRKGINQSGLQDNQKSEIGDAIDRVAATVEARGRLFESIEKKPASPSEKASTLLRLMTAETFTEPRLSTQAREMVIGYLSKPGFLTGYVAQSAKPGTERDVIVADLMRILEKAGITPETGLKSIAA